MTTPALEQTEADIEHLSLAEQLWLMERLAHRIRTCTLRTPTGAGERLSGHGPRSSHSARVGTN